ncbi:TPA: YitT family protein [Streptococcus pneumoniae]|uniref:YitT family protein n=1 Tax=Streptococcus pneumoniae TaxID=1313 RepID=UPI00027365CA|nr:YitT family protein [Streptococcus pneumoniae]EJG98384.1 NAD-dependent DNA ligase LigA [Streptococcus pneumoniae GA60190]
MIKKIYPIFTILLGAAIYAFGLTYFVVPHHLFEGGATGITLITFYLFKIPVSLMNLLINIPLFILAWKIFGAKSLYSSLLGTLALSAWLAFFEHIPLHIDLQGDLLITALIAGILLGIGLGIIFNAGGTTGGTDILARILNKYTHISIGKLLFILDFCILMLILLIFKDLRLVSYTLLFDFIVSRVIDLIGEGGYAGKDFMIITKRPDQLAKAINDDLGRGVTFISGQGYYSKENLKIIYCIVGRNEIVKTKEMIHRIDPQAFITITEAHEILGEGFTFEKE